MFSKIEIFTVYIHLRCVFVYLVSLEFSFVQVSVFSFVRHLLPVLCCFIYSFPLSPMLITFCFDVVLRGDEFRTLPLHSDSLPIYSVLNVKHNWNGKHIASNVIEFRIKCFQLYRSFCSRSRVILGPLSPHLFRSDEIRSWTATSSPPLNRKRHS